MRLTEYARRMGVSPQTARKWFHEGRIQGAYQLDTGTIIMPDVDNSSSPKPEKTVIYARVSSYDQKEDLDRQARRLIDFAVSRGYIVDSCQKEIASGLNDKRPKLEKILRDKNVTRIIVEHKDRLTRFGFHYIETLLARDNVELIVVNNIEENDKSDLVADFVSIITSFCARIYGQRRGKRKTDVITKELLNS